MVADIAGTADPCHDNPAAATNANLPFHIVLNAGRPLRPPASATISSFARSIPANATPESTPASCAREKNGAKPKPKRWRHPGQRLLKNSRRHSRRRRPGRSSIGRTGGQIRRRPEELRPCVPSPAECRNRLRGPLPPGMESSTHTHPSSMIISVI